MSSCILPTVKQSPQSSPVGPLQCPLHPNKSVMDLRSEKACPVGCPPPKHVLSAQASGDLCQILNCVARTRGSCLVLASCKNMEEFKETVTGSFKGYLLLARPVSQGLGTK